MIEHFETHRPFMFALAYRMLGTVTDAEDVIQDTFLRVEGKSADTIQNTKSYFATVVTRLCLNRMSARSDRDTYLGPWLPEPIPTNRQLTATAPDYRTETLDSLSIAFMMLLEQLSSAERAVFLLHDVFDYKHREIATILDKTVPACRQLLRRAKQHIAANRPRFEQDPVKHTLFLNHFIEVVESGEIETFLQLLADDVTLVPDGGGQRGAAIRVMHGRDPVAKFIIGTRRLAPNGLTFQLRELNGKPAIVAYTSTQKPFFALFLETQSGVVQLMHVIAGKKLSHVC